MTFPAWEAAHTARVVLNETLSAKTISAPSCGQNVARNLAPKCASMQLQILFRWSQAKTTEKKTLKKWSLFIRLIDAKFNTQTRSLVPVLSFFIWHLWSPTTLKSMEDVQCKLQRMTWNTCSDGCTWPQPFRKNTIRCRQREMKKTAISKTKKIEKLKILASRWVCCFECYFLTKLCLTRVN